MIHFVCEKINDHSGKILKIYHQQKRALDCMTRTGIYVVSINPAIFPAAAELKVNTILNEYNFVI